MSALVVRRDNLIGPRLAQSDCHFFFALPAPLALQDLGLADFFRHGGQAEARLEQGESVLHLRIPHSAMDAFGGLFVLANSAALTAVASPNRNTSGARSLTAGDSLVFHSWTSAAYATAGPEHPTFLQAYLAAATDALSAETIDVCVACEDVAQLDAVSIGGNSLGIARVARARLRREAQGPRRAWRDFLEKRALRSLHGDAAGSSGPASQILVSSLGVLDRLPWCRPHLEPSRLVMFPTPMPGCAHVILWSAGGRQAITLGCRTADLQLLQRPMDSLLDAWKGIFR